MQGIINLQTLTDIADAIRSKTNSEETFTPSQMATAIEGIQSGGENVLIGSSTEIYNGMIAICGEITEVEE